MSNLAILYFLVKLFLPLPPRGVEILKGKVSGLEPGVYYPSANYRSSQWPLWQEYVRLHREDSGSLGGGVCLQGRQLGELKGASGVWVNPLQSFLALPTSIVALWSLFEKA